MSRKSKFFGKSQVKRKANRYSLYVIKWFDAYATGSWKDMDKCQTEELTVHSVGWLVYEDKSYYILAQQLSSVNTCADRIQIPKVCVKSIHRLKGFDIEYRSS